MIPVVTVAEMQAIDAEALATVSHETLVDRAGTAVAAAALRLLGGAYGRRVVVVAGKGSNGADGRVAADRLRRRGARVQVVEAADAPDRLARTAGSTWSSTPPTAPVSAAATGRRRSRPASRVLAVDIPSGIDGDSGEACGEPLRADVTVTFAALKPGLLQGDGPLLAGRVEVVDIGLDVDRARLRWSRTPTWPGSCPSGPGGLQVAVGRGRGGRLARDDGGGRALRPRRLPGRGRDGPARRARGRHRPADGGRGGGRRAAGRGLGRSALDMVTRCHALVVGPGLGRAEDTGPEVRRLVAGAAVPVVVDADGLFALGAGPRSLPPSAPRPGDDQDVRCVLTPHDGEFARLAGAAPGEDRIAAARGLAAQSGAVILLKGPTTVVARPEGRRCWSPPAHPGWPRPGRATSSPVPSEPSWAGVSPLEAAGLAAHVHGRAAALGRPRAWWPATWPTCSVAGSRMSAVADHLRPPGLRPHLGRDRSGRRPPQRRLLLPRGPAGRALRRGQGRRLRPRQRRRGPGRPGRRSPLAGRGPGRRGGRAARCRHRGSRPPPLRAHGRRHGHGGGPGLTPTLTTRHGVSAAAGRPTPPAPSSPSR